VTKKWTMLGDKGGKRGEGEEVRIENLVDIPTSMTIYKRMNIDFGF
jgi:hypothetical protein